MRKKVNPKGDLDCDELWLWDERICRGGSGASGGRYCRTTFRRTSKYWFDNNIGLRLINKEK